MLAAVVDELVAMDPDCSILLAGSLARGEEREDSDIDLHVCLSRKPEQFTDLIGEHNYQRWHVCAEREGIKIDVGWRLLDRLEREWSGPLVHYYMLVGQSIRDPTGGQARWLAAQRRWLDQRPWLEEVWARQLEEVSRHKKDPSYPLRFNEREFYDYLRELVAQRESGTSQPAAARGPGTAGVEPGQ